MQQAVLSDLAFFAKTGLSVGYKNAARSCFSEAFIFFLKTGQTTGHYSSSNLFKKLFGYGLPRHLQRRIPPQVFGSFTKNLQMI